MAVVPADVQAHVTEAEYKWRDGDRQGALLEWEAALERACGDSAVEGIVLVGKGYALLMQASNNDGDRDLFAEAVECFEKARESASDSQQAFLDNLLSRAREGLSRNDIPSSIGRVETVLAAAGIAMERDPSLKIHGGALPDGSFLNEGLIAAQCESQKTCVGGGGASTLGLTPEEQAIVELVAKDGAEGWEDKAAELSRKFHREFLAGAVEQEWHRIAPAVKEILSTNPEMPCGHTCGTCPTRSSCHLHDELQDVEDLA
eukprot:Sspe_Gene.79932::Locus_50238_Transcript_1_1_Confidence_1.000_Length_907::g.79932::m.79932